MSKRILEIYALSVCFVSIGCLSIFGGIFLYTLVEISFPSKMIPSPRHYPPPIFSQNGTMTTPMFPGQPLPEISGPEVAENADEKNRQFQEERKRFEILEVERIRTESNMSIVRSIIIIFIASIVFVFHWRIAKRARNNDT